MKRIVVILLILVPGASQLFSQVIEVPVDQSSIQSAIEAASAGDTILVEEGRYYENINFLGKAITVASRFIMDGDTAHISRTIIDGSNATNPDKASVVTMWSGEDTTSVLMGLTITGGKGTLYQKGGWTPFAGAGICVMNSGGKIEHNIIEDNHLNPKNGYSFYTGAGINASVNRNHTAVIRNNLIRNNSIEGDNTYGAGTYLEGGRIILECNSIVENSAEGITTCVGVGIYHNNEGEPGTTEELIIRNNMISGNKGFSKGIWRFGGGIGVGLPFENGNIEIYNNVICNNTMEGTGGGCAFLNWNNPTVLYNNTIVNNSATEPGNNISVMECGLVMFNNIVWSDSTIDGVDFSVKEYPGDSLFVHNNILKEPMESSEQVVSENNFYLAPIFKTDSTYFLDEGSPGIGWGVASIQFNETNYDAPTCDYEGNPRPDPIDTFVDIGALESGALQVKSSIADLVVIRLGKYVLTPEFDRDSLNYSMRLPFDYDAITALQAIPVDGWASVDINHATGFPFGNESERTSTINVISADASHQKTYTVRLDTSSTNALLCELSVEEGYTLEPPFDSLIFDYSVKIPDGDPNPKISCRCADERAEVNVRNLNSFARITVTAEAGNTRVYSVDYITGIDDFNPSSRVHIYPNPTSTLLTIETMHAGLCSIEITSLSGQEIYQGEMDGTTNQIDMTPFQNGVYFVTVRSEEFVRTEKVVKMK